MTSTREPLPRGLQEVEPPEREEEDQRPNGDGHHAPVEAPSVDGGEQLAKPLGAWDDGSSIFRPVVVVVAPDGREAFHELSRDFTDRTDDEPVLAALEALGLAPVPAGPGWAPDVEPQASKRAFQPSSFIPYFRAIRFNTMALSERMVDQRDREQLVTEKEMAESFLAAFDDWRAEHPPDR